MDDPLELRFFTRPGCGFSMRLRRQLDQAGISYEPIDIWDDPEAAAVVRSVARGHETVPTLLLGDRAMVNPRLHEVLDALADDAPHLVPDDEPASTRGLLDRAASRLRRDAPAPER